MMLAIGCSFLFFLLLERGLDPIFEGMFPQSEQDYQEMIQSLIKSPITSSMQGMYTCSRYGRNTDAGSSFGRIEKFLRNSNCIIDFCYVFCMSALSYGANVISVCVWYCFGIALYNRRGTYVLIYYSWKDGGHTRIACQNM